MTSLSHGKLANSLQQANKLRNVNFNFIRVKGQGGGFLGTPIELAVPVAPETDLFLG